MEDSIINLDDCDPFSLSSDTDIRNIVDQWKRNDTSPSSKDSKYFDTRTFTRPKKKSFTVADAEAFERRLNAAKGLDSASVAEPKIDLKIGGLVTSMQRSFLGDVSPPPNMDSSIGNSLITSGDFSNVNDFFNGADDSLSMTHFKQYRLSDAINDRHFLERLTNYDDSLFTKEMDINNIDGNHLIDTVNSSSSTLQNSTDSSSNQSRHEDTFTAVCPTNGTFDADAGIDRTFIQVDELNGSVKNGTFNFENGEFLNNNKTFEAQPHDKSTNKTFEAQPHDNSNDKTFEAQPHEISKANIWNQTVDLIDDEDMSLCATSICNEFKIPETPAPFIPPNPSVPSKPVTQTGGVYPNDLESTPARQNLRKTRQSTSLANISPIVPENRQTVDKFVDIEIENELPEIFLRRTESKNLSLMDKERRSLANFEEFENTLLILENKNEEEFDDLLNSFSANIRNPLSDKVRQSLDNIKKRHSSIGVEKQQEDEMSREKTPQNGKYSSSDRNRTIESHGSPAMVSSSTSVGSGSGERLLRRSRVFDDNTLNLSTSQVADNLNGTTVVLSHESSDENTTEVLNRKNLPHLDNDTMQKTDDNEALYNTEEATIKRGRAPKNRDRFKTIRIFKKPPEDAVQIPDAEEEYIQVAEPIGPRALPMQATEVFASKNRNSPFKANQEHMTPEQKAINTMTFKKSALARPRQLLGGLQRREMYAKSGSHEMLSSDDNSRLESTFTQPKAAAQIKSPMGFKSKSVHNLLGARNTPNNATFEQSPLSAAHPSTSSNTFKMPAPRAIPTMRQKTSIAPVQSRGLVRPSSGYYGYASRRTDSDTESGRFSSTNSLSSGSSKSSLSRGETPESQYTATNENPNATFAQASQASNVSSIANAPAPRPSMGGPSKLAQPKLSLLRPPTQIRRSGLPRPTVTPAKR